jgi:hypothetical protein
MGKIVLIVVTGLIALLMLRLTYRYMKENKSGPAGIFLVCAGLTLWGGFRIHSILSDAKAEIEDRKARWAAEEATSHPSHAEMPPVPIPPIEFKGTPNWTIAAEIIAVLLLLFSGVCLWNAHSVPARWGYWLGAGLIFTAAMLFSFSLTWGRPKFRADGRGIEMTRSFLGLFESHVRVPWNLVREAALEYEYPRRPKSRSRDYSQGPSRINVNLYGLDGRQIMKVIPPLGGNDQMKHLSEAISAWSGREVLD